MPNQVYKLQNTCFLIIGATDPRCSFQDLDAKYEQNRVSFARKDAVCRKHLKAIKNRDVVIGAPYKCTILALGMPDTVNTTRTANGSRQQFVYGNGHYVYTHNGIVEAEQSH